MEQSAASVQNFLKHGLGIPIGLILLLTMMILPVHPFLLDLFFTFSISLSLLVLLAGMYTIRPLDFAIFPTVLLLATLFRLALNVASTRVVLLNGHIGSDAAGKVIESFGAVVIGGNYAVGLVVFAILVIINFVVITKGAGRISEVTARFTLDAMPGKQMAIDADLNAGIIDQEEAKTRREEIGKESDFYGAMDGASKFVRGDAIAGILILLINLIGGIAIGVFQHNLSFAAATKTYALLTIGDGLAAQIPGLVLSTSAAMMVTRVSKSSDLSSQVLFQVFSKAKPIYVAAGILIALGLIPGMPHIAFTGLGGAMLFLGYRINRPAVVKQDAPEQTEQEMEEQAQQEETNKEISWEDVPPLDTIGLEIGYRLIPLVDKEQSGELMKRIKGVRKKLSQELGFLVPSVHIRDNLDLPPNGYRIYVLGVTVGENKIYPDKMLAINPGHVFGELEGIKVKDPSFDLDACWIAESQKQHAQTLGYTVVDPSTVVATHMSQILQGHAHQLIGHEEVQKLMDILSRDAPKLVEDLIPKTLTLGVVVKVLQNLLKEGIPIRDIRTIAEILAEAGQKFQEPHHLTELVRKGLGPMIVQQINGFSKELPVITLNPNLEQILQQSVQQTESGESLVIEPNLAEQLQKGIRETAEKQEVAGMPLIMIVPSAIRLMMSKFIRSFMPAISVLAYQEIPEDKHIKITATIGNG